MTSVFAVYATMLADALQGLYVWTVVALSLWRAFQRPFDHPRWLHVLGIAVLAGACGSPIGASVSVEVMSERYFSTDEIERDVLMRRWFGPYAWSYWAKPLALILVSSVLFFTRRRRSWWIVWAMAFLLTDPFDLFERLVMVITSLHRDYLPTSWTLHHTWLDLLTPITLLICALLMWRTERGESSRLS